MMKRREIFILSCTVVLLIISMLCNTLYLSNILKEKTDMYVQDISNQSAGNLSYQIDSNLNYMEQLASTISRMPQLTDMSDFLQRKANALRFDLIAIVSQDGEIIKNDFQSDCFDNWIALNQISYEKTELFSLDGHALLFSVPMTNDRGNERVLVGILEQKSMQQILTQMNFDGNGLACVVDVMGNIVIAPTDPQTFMQFSEIIYKDGERHVSKDLKKMIDETNRKASGILYFSTVSNEDLILCYSPLNINDWFLITIVRQDLIKGDINIYELRSLAVVAGVFVVCTILIFLIISAYEKSRKRLEEITMIDPLTKDDNNPAFQMKLKALIAQNPPATFTLVFLNIKGFQLINENVGIPAGDNILKHMHRVLKASLKESELVCRSEMDHFFLCLRDPSEEVVTARIAKITESLNSFNEYTDIAYGLVLEAGGYLIDDPDLEVRTMQDRARFASIRAQGKSVCSFFGRALLEQVRKEAGLNSIFDASIKHRDFQVYLQPKVGLSDMNLCGAEALVRWEHPEYGMISPSDFIPLFEKNEKICILDLYVFEEVCKWMRNSMEEGEPLIPISVNLSRTHIKNLNFLREFVDIKEKYQIPDHMIEFEITESVLINVEQIKLIKNMINEMHRNGFHCSLDDFGFGYSSLALLKELDIDVIKLDKNFFDDMNNQKSQNIISGFIEIAHKLGMKVVAEGIETQEQLDCLCCLHCDAVQGYIFSKPLSISDFETWSRARTAAGRPDTCAASLSAASASAVKKLL